MMLFIFLLCFISLCEGGCRRRMYTVQAISLQFLNYGGNFKYQGIPVLKIEYMPLIKYLRKNI